MESYFGGRLRCEHFLINDIIRNAFRSISAAMALVHNNVALITLNNIYATSRRRDRAMIRPGKKPVAFEDLYRFDISLDSDVRKILRGGPRARCFKADPA